MNDWREHIQACGNNELAEALIACIEDLFAQDAHLLTVNTHEITILIHVRKALTAVSLFVPGVLAAWPIRNV